MRLKVNMTDPNSGEIVSFSSASVEIRRDGASGGGGAAT